jgi:hypothetical protein
VNGSPGRYWGRWEDNIKLDFEGIVYKYADWTYQVHDWFHWQYLVNTAMKGLGP